MAGTIHPVVGAILEHRRAHLWAAAIAIVLTLPSLWAGKAIDDHLHDLMLAGGRGLPGPPPSPLDLFSFTSGNSERMRASLDLGLLPWWTAPDHHVAFFRPIASLTHVLDFHLWRNHPALMHLHSVIWYGALVLAAGFLYRRTVPVARTAGLAALLYGIDDAHGMTVGWIANRNAVMAAAFGVLALIVHDRWVRDGWRPGALIAPATLLLALLSAEAAVATCAYLAAHALFLDRGSLLGRVLRLVPCGAVVLVWSILYRRMGFGAWGSSLYVDPRDHPLAFLVAAAHRIPLLLGGQLAGPPADLSFMLAGAPVKLLFVFALLVMTVSSIVVLGLVARDRVARFWAAGMVLATVPASAAFPSDRMLLFIGLGGMGLVACFLTSSVPPSGASRWLNRAVLLACTMLHLVAAPLLLPLRCFTVTLIGRTTERGIRSVDGDPDMTSKDVVLVNSPSDFVSVYVPILRASLGQQIPAHTRPLASALRSVRALREDERTLVVTEEGGYLATGMEQILRGPGYPFVPGSTVNLPGLSCEVRAVTPDGRPLDVAFRFDVPLEDPKLRFYVWRLDRFVPWRPPGVGRSEILPALRLSDLRF